MDQEEAKTIVEKEDRERVIYALDSVFRRLLANLLLDFDNPRFRKVRPANDTVRRNTEGLSKQFVQLLFRVLGFTGEPDAEGFVHFSGSRDTLKTADEIYSSIENAANEPKNTEAAFALSVMAQNKRQRQQEKPLAHSKTADEETSDTKSPLPSSPAQPLQQTLAEQIREKYLKDVFNPDDFSSVEHLKPIVRKTLLNAGRVRNCFFESKGLTIRRMIHGRVYACTEKCSNECLEAHWHLYTGKGMLYAYVAHLSSDGAALIHTGAEHGYQYNSLPGTPNFGKTTHFTEKLVAPEGNLVYNKHPNKVTDACIYCGESFYKLFL